MNIPLFFGKDSVVPELVAICGRNSEKISEIKNSFGFKETYSDWKRLVADPKVQLVDNCGPPSLHKDSCIAAAEAGKSILCEKPLARTSEEAYDIYKKAEISGVIGLTGFCVRFAPAVTLAKNLIDSGKLGKIFNMRCSYMNVETGGLGFLDPLHPLNWHFDREIAGQGAIADLGSHVLDMVYYLLGEVTEVCGASETIVNERPLQDDPSKKGKVTVDDVTVAALKLKSGALAVIDSSWMASGRKDYFYFEVNGTNGSIRFDFERLDELEVFMKDGSDYEGFKNVIVTSKKHPDMEKFWHEQGAGFSWNHLFILEQKFLLDCVAQGKQVEGQGPSLRDGYINQLLIDSIVEANKAGQWIPIRPKA